MLCFITFSSNKRAVNRLASVVRDVARRSLNQELKIAINITAKKGRKIISREIKEELNLPIRRLQKDTRVSKKASRTNLAAQIELKKRPRPGIEESLGKARQTRKGVTAKIDTRKARSVKPGGFMGAKPGQTSVKLRGRAFVRTGKARYPIVRLHGASPWGAFVKRKKSKPTKKSVKNELTTQIERRVRAMLVRKGLIK